MPLPEVTAVSILLQAAPWVSLAVRRGSSAEVSVQIPSDAERDVDDPQECLVWQFELQEFDIGFQLLENGAAVHALTRYKADATDLSTDLSTDATLRHRQQQLGTVEPMMEGRFDDVKRGGVYTFRWDNSYSLVRHKQVQYRFLATSKRAVAAAELAVQESQSRSQRRARRAAAGLPLPHLAKTLARERVMTEDEVAMEREKIMARFEQAVMDIVSIFISKPDSPLHEGAIRPFILALEAVLRNGIKEEFLDSWPEEPYYELLMETNTVLRDDLGVVAEVEAGEPPTNLQYLGWNRSRSFLFLVLNKNILHRAFENLSKRRMLMEKHYEPRALLYKYANATKLASILSALNGVQFLLAPYPIDECTAADGKQFPQNLQQCAPEAPLVGNEISFRDEFTGDSCVVKDVDEDPEEIKQLENCTLPRYILHGQPLEDVIIGRSSIEVLPFSAMGSSLIFLGQFRIQTQDIHISLIIENDRALTEPLRLSAADGWVEVIIRLKTIPTHRLALKLDNSYSVVRTKQVQLRYSTVDTQAYSTAWEGCQEMAQSISWNYASKAGGERCAEFMASLLLEEEREVTLQRNREASGDGAHDGGDEGLMKFSTALLSRPVSYLVNGLLSTEGGVEACDQCLTPFSFFSRQHSCPSCQKVVCVQCSRHYVQINGKGPQLKVCDGCFIKEKEKERKRLASLQGNGSSQGGERPEFAALRRDPAMEKYFKMLSFGVPASGVAQKMTQDDMPPEKVAIFAAGPDGSSASPLSSAAKRKQAAGRGLARRDSTFRKVHWTSLETKKANETIWSRVTARRKTAPITLSPHDFQELEYLFGNPTAASPSAKIKSSQSSKKNKFSALDSRRSNNISIGLNQFKMVGGSQAILTALKSCDFEFLTADRLANLQDIAPNSVEMKRYSDFRGSRSRLEPAEKFLVEMCEISRVTDKIGAMLFASQFEHQQQELRSRIQVITRACYEVLQSERLARCFELVLAIGNLLNTGTELEDAHGVTLASLLKLSETKAIDQSMTLLQFIIKLIHDRGEGDVLLFIKDLSSLAEAKRFSNMICESQARALQHGITQLEQEIKEDMVDDLKQFSKAEALRKRRFEEQNRRPPLVQARKPAVHVGSSPNGAADGSSRPRNALLGAIRHRSTDEEGPAGAQKETAASSSGNPHLAMMAAIRNRGAKLETVQANDTAVNPRASMLSAIQARSSSESNGKLEVGATELTDATSPALRRSNSASLDAIRKQPHKATTEKGETSASGEAESSGVPTRMPGEKASMNGGTVAEQGTEARSSLLAAIRQRQEPSANSEGESSSANGSSTKRSALLTAIKQHAMASTPEDAAASAQAGQHPLSNGSQGALLAAIRGRSAEVQGEQQTASGRATNGTKGEQYEPREYKMESSFIDIMRGRLMNIKVAFEDVEMEVETLNSVWEATARYLAEDPAGSSSEYVFNLLNRFLLDVKVAKSLLFRKGLSFATEANALLPHAHVGSTVATTFGSGVITALRIADRRIEVKFPWSRETYLSPSCILSPGSLVRCRRFGVGIIRETSYDVGFCDVRFQFGYGKVRVEDLTSETSSNKDELRLDVLRAGFAIYDPVVTPFGCGYIQSIRGNPRSSTAVISVGLLTTETDAHDRQRISTGIAFVPASRVQRNY